MSVKIYYLLYKLSAEAICGFLFLGALGTIGLMMRRPAVRQIYGALSRSLLKKCLRINYFEHLESCHDLFISMLQLIQQAMLHNLTH